MNVLYLKNRPNVLFNLILPCKLLLKSFNWKYIRFIVYRVVILVCNYTNKLSPAEAQDMIDNRPKYLFDLEYYKKIPGEFSLDLSLFPNLLSADISFLDKSCQPYTNKVEDIYRCNFDYHEALLEFYNAKSIQFEMVHIVANVYDFKWVDDTYVAVPYSLSIVGSLKRGKPQFVSPEIALMLQSSELFENTLNYSHFDPFEGNHGLFTSMFTGLIGDSFTDELGLIVGTYFLSSNYDNSGIILPGPIERDSFTQTKFLNYREKKYFKPLLNKTPRKIWGADSPIELFVLQGLSRYGFYPEIQTLIFDDGSIYPNYYEMVNQDSWIKGRIRTTELDIFFPEQRLAIFCDSHYHRGKKKKQSADKINKVLQNLDIKVIRINSKDILNSKPDFLYRIINELVK